MEQERGREHWKTLTAFVTVVADLVAAFLFVNAFEGELRIELTGRMGGVFGLLVLAGIIFHIAGSFADHRRRNPTSATAIAGTLALGLVAAGAAGWIAGAAYPEFPLSSMRPLGAAVALGVIILVTTQWFTSSDLRPIGAGLRRGAGWLLGMSVAKASSVAFTDFEMSAAAAAEWAWNVKTFAGFTRAEWLVASAVALYITGITWLHEHANTESSTTESPSRSTAGWRTELVAGMSATLAGILLLIPLPRLVVGTSSLFASDPSRWAILISALTMLALLRNFRLLTAARRRTPHRTESELIDGIYRQGMTATIFLDAAICAVTAGFVGVAWVLPFVIPTFLLQRYAAAENNSSQQ